MNNLRFGVLTFLLLLLGIGGATAVGYATYLLVMQPEPESLEQSMDMFSTYRAWDMMTAGILAIIGSLLSCIAIVLTDQIRA